MSYGVRSRNSTSIGYDTGSRRRRDDLGTCGRRNISFDHGAERFSALGTCMAFNRSDETAGLALNRRQSIANAVYTPVTSVHGVFSIHERVLE